jgi:hypothetical protein
MSLDWKKCKENENTIIGIECQFNKFYIKCYWNENNSVKLEIDIQRENIKIEKVLKLKNGNDIPSKNERIKTLVDNYLKSNLIDTEQDFNIIMENRGELTFKKLENENCESTNFYIFEDLDKPSIYNFILGFSFFLREDRISDYIKLTDNKPLYNKKTEGGIEECIIQLGASLQENNDTDSENLENLVKESPGNVEYDDVSESLEDDRTVIQHDLSKKEKVIDNLLLSLDKYYSVKNWKVNYKSDNKKRVVSFKLKNNKFSSENLFEYWSSDEEKSLSDVSDEIITEDTELPPAALSVFKICCSLMSKKC